MNTSVRRVFWQFQITRPVFYTTICFIQFRKIFKIQSFSLAYWTAYHGWSEDGSQIKKIKDTRDNIAIDY